MRRCFEPHISPPVVLYFMYLNILFTMISNELKLHFGKISLQNVTAFPLTQEDYAPVSEQINIFLKIKLIFFERLLHIRFLLYLFFSYA